jgi:hypothetical protein
MNHWWTAQQAGLIGGVAGSVVGIMGGLLGTIAGIYAPQGKLKGLVYGLTATIIGAGGISLITGIVALLLGQPYFVYYPLLLIGSVCVISLGSLVPVIRLRYREADHRRLEAEEIRRS